jgi:hypothetical protein
MAALGYVLDVYYVNIQTRHILLEITCTRAVFRQINILQYDEYLLYLVQ